MFRARGRRGKRNFAVLKKDARRNFTLKRPWRFVWLVIAKFVVSRCAFCKLRGNFGFFCSVNHLNGPIRKHMFTCTSSEGHGLWFVIGGFRSVLFVSCFNVRCFVIVLFRTIMDELSLLRRLFWFFLFLSLARISNLCLLPSTKIHSSSRFPSLFLSSLECFSVKLGEHVALWFALTPPSPKWLTEQKTPSLK